MYGCCGGETTIVHKPRRKTTAAFHGSLDADEQLNARAKKNLQQEPVYLGYNTRLPFPLHLAPVQQAWLGRRFDGVLFLVPDSNSQ